MLLHIQHRIEIPSTVHAVASCFSGGSHGSTCNGVMYNNSAEIPDMYLMHMFISSHMQCIQSEVEFNVLLYCLVTPVCSFSSCTTGMFSILRTTNILDRKIIYLGGD